MTASKIIPAYAYVEYADDPDIVAFFTAYNALAQQLLDDFNALNLPVYSGLQIVGSLLDWVLTGLYGVVRPALPSGVTKSYGPYGTAYYGQLPYGGRRAIGSGTFYATTDDVYKRIATWALYKGDGRVFSIRWLKRRVMRFLTGLNGTDGATDQTYQVSVTFGAGNNVTIRILPGVRIVKGGAIYGRFSYGTASYGQLNSTFQSYAQVALGPILKSAIQSGVLELPFQFTYTVIA